MSRNGEVIVKFSVFAFLILVWILATMTCILLVSLNNLDIVSKHSIITMLLIVIAVATSGLALFKVGIPTFDRFLKSF